jgi:hypothetical protein
MGTDVLAGLASRSFQPRVYGVGAWTDNLHFADDLVALLKPRLLVELGTLCSTPHAAGAKFGVHSGSPLQTLHLFFCLAQRVSSAKRGVGREHSSPDAAAREQCGVVWEA